MMNLWRLLMVAICVGASALAGCGDNGGAPAGAEKKKITIGIVAKSVSNPVFQAACGGEGCGEGVVGEVGHGD